MPPIPLVERQNLTVSEAMHLMKFGRASVIEYCESGKWRWFYHGTERRIITKSILEQQDHDSKAA